ncbi:MAG TPA: hypothetical protein VFJ18_07260 [Pararhizobium sp.]|nr:hypothetical protein [Pararhizobium sp.]
MSPDLRPVLAKRAKTAAEAAEDRDLIPTMRTGEAVAIYEQGYSVHGLYARLTEGRALNPAAIK